MKKKKKIMTVPLYTYKLLNSHNMRWVVKLRMPSGRRVWEEVPLPSERGVERGAPLSQNFMIL